jgi:TolA-binding protein
LEEKLVDI